MKIRIALFIGITILSACSGSKSCDNNKAMNKMLALNKLQGRLVAQGGEALVELSGAIGSESGKISELIAQQKYEEACAKADEVAKKLEVDLDKEQEGMITFEQLAKDGGKGSGTCGIAEAAKKQMELHGLLQKEVDAGRMNSDIFSTFNEDTKGYAEMLSTNPSKACELFDNLKVKYKLEATS